MIASDILGRVRPVLLDTDSSAYRWSDADLLTYINDAVRLILVHRPDASTLTVSATLVAGSRQTLNTDYEKLVDVVCNKNADGSNGRAVTLIEQSTLDAFDPSWRSGTAKSVVKHFMIDPRNSREFEVYPPATAGAQIYIRASAVPTQVTAAGNTIPIRDVYMEPVVNFVLYKAYTRDAEFAQNAQLAAGYASTFSSLLGIKLGKDVAFSPEFNRKGGEPDTAVQIGGV